MPVRASVNIQDVKKRLRRLQIQLGDMRPLWRILRTEYIITSVQNIFSTNGRGTWAPTQRTNPILRDTRALYKSYTQQSAPGNISVETATTFEWGSSIDYAQYHEEGTTRLPIRRVLGLLTGPGEDAKQVNIIERWVESLTRRV